MKCVYSSPDSSQVGMILSVLEVAKISCEVRNEAVSQTFIGLEFAPEIWVMDEDYEDAASLVAVSRRK